MSLIPEIETTELRRRLNAGEQPHMIDVREHDEVIAGMIPGAIHIPLGEIPQRMNEIPQDQEVILICRSGGRSTHACQYLQQFGLNCTNMTGGMLQWHADEDNQ